MPNGACPFVCLLQQTTDIQTHEQTSADKLIIITMRTKDIGTSLVLKERPWILVLFYLACVGVDILYDGVIIIFSCCYHWGKGRVL